ncbi:MAG: hypothetical protein J1F35_04690 [Erysipelotrichales bacterium]|nr:hypothetical protein [Erysipelotrichales bacterium]
MKKTLLLDVDEVICFSGFLEAINEFMGTSYVIDDFTDYYIDEVAIPKEKMEEFNKFISEKNLYHKDQILPNAIEVLKELSEVYDIYICSSCLNFFNPKKSGYFFKYKFDFLVEYFPFLKPENFIFTNAKHIFKADIQIDDRLSNLDNDIETRILFPSYHNKNITDEELNALGVIRAGYDWRDGWNEIRNILLKKEIIKKLQS